MSTELTVSEEMQEAITGMAQVRNALMKLAKEVLVKGQDFGVIPGVSKPSLLKPGAEKLLSFFQLSITIDCTEKVMDLKTRFLSYTYKCTVKNREDRELTQCEGSVNSYETKYRYTWIAMDKPADPAIEKKLIAEKTGKYNKGANGYYWTQRVENPDVIGLQNTIQKMAQKRAIVGAVLLATGASEFFTQDVEDMEFINVDNTVMDQKPAAQVADPKIKSEPDSTEAVIVPEPTTTEKVASMQKNKTVQIKMNTGGAGILSVPEETKTAIQEATDLSALSRIYNECVGLHTTPEFTTLLTCRKNELKNLKTETVS